MKKPKKSLQYLQKEIEKNVNWKRVRKIMIALEWRYVVSANRNYAPTIQEIKDCVFMLLAEGYDTESEISTGGFSVKWEKGKVLVSFIPVYVIIS